MNLYSESNGTSARRGYARRVSSASTPSLAEDHERGLGRVADDCAVVGYGSVAASVRP